MLYVNHKQPRRMVVAGRIGPRGISVDVDPAFGSEDEWQAIPEVHVLSDAEMEEHNADYRDWQEDVDWMRGGC